MAKPYALKEVEKRHGPLDKIIPETVNKTGSQKAAAEVLGVSPYTIHAWLKDNGYIAITRYVKAHEEMNAC